ncbi:MAG: aspartyl protease family protein [Pirellulales bacterium]
MFDGGIARTAWFLATALGVLAAIIAATAIARAAAAKQSRTRADVLTALAAAEQELQNKPQDSAARYQLAHLLYESGDFWRAADVVRPAADAENATPQTMLLAADLEYLLGHYAAAEKGYQRALAVDALDRTSRTRANVGLGFVSYQTNRFDLFKELTFGPGVAFPGDKLLRTFEEQPYQITWHNESHTAEVPFIATDPLPVMTVEYDGRAVQVLFDTGADMCILDTELARAWGVKEVSWTVGGFGGGKLERLGYGKLPALKLGDVTLENVPIWILPTQRFSAVWPDKKLSLGGIIGTALIRQFLATLDYRQGKLLLRERSPQARAALRQELGSSVSAEVPFVLSSTHWMMARGALNDRDGLTFFVDSGLASEAGFSAPPQTLGYVNIAEPKTQVQPNSVGGGGGAWASGFFPIESLGLGRLRQQQLQGEFGSRPASSYWQSGFIQDGLISHRFLREYASWSIDFDSMTYLFGAELPQ